MAGKDRTAQRKTVMGKHDKFYARQCSTTYCFLAHLSRRLINELIGYSWSGIRPSSVRRRPSLTISNIFFSETARPIKTKFYMEPP